MIRRGCEKEEVHLFVRFKLGLAKGSQKKKTADKPGIEK